MQNKVKSFEELKNQAKECAAITRPDLATLAGKEPKTLEEVDALVAQVEAEVRAAGEEAGQCARVYQSMQKLIQ